MSNPEPQLVDSDPALEATGLVHRVARPDGPGPHPAVVMIAGRSGNEDVMWVFARTAPTGWLLVAPRAIQEDPDGGYSWHPRQQDEWPDLATFDPAVVSLARFIRALPDLYQADSRRIYLLGFSQGAAAAFALAMRHPGLVQGIAALVGFIPGECGDGHLANLAGRPVFMAVGRQDERIPYEMSQQCATVLREAGADLVYHEYDTGHRLTAQGMRDLSAWWQQVENR